MERLFAGTRELYRFFGIDCKPTGQNVGLQVDAALLEGDQAFDFLMDGNLPESVKAQPLLDKQPAMDDNSKQISD